MWSDYLSASILEISDKAKYITICDKSGIIISQQNKTLFFRHLALSHYGRLKKKKFYNNHLALVTPVTLIPP